MRVRCAAVVEATGLAKHVVVVVGSTRTWVATEVIVMAIPVTLSATVFGHNTYVFSFELQRIFNSSKIHKKLCLEQSPSCLSKKSTKSVLAAIVFKQIKEKTAPFKYKNVHVNIYL